MINEIVIDNVTSYKKRAVISCEKKVGLFYGLNGAGKSTISNYLYDPEIDDFKDCSYTTAGEIEVLVYNQSFVEEYFHEEDNLKGIFTLSKENRNARNDIKIKEGELKNLNIELESKQNQIDELDNEIQNSENSAAEKVWEIKKDYTGGDRVFEYCFENLRGNKKKLFEYVLSVILPENEPDYGIDNLRKRIEELNASDAAELNEIDILQIGSTEIENNLIFTKPIVGSKEGNVADFIARLNNYDWIRSGLKYVSAGETNKDRCPFCQSRTITDELINDIHKVFDDTYDKAIELIVILKNEYFEAVNEFDIGKIEENHIIDKETIEKWDLMRDNLVSLYNENKLLIEKKLESPSSVINLKSSADIIKDINKIIISINEKVSQFNERLKNKSQELSNVKIQFWQLMRWKYDQTIQVYNQALKKSKEKKQRLLSQKQEIANNVSRIENQISTLRASTVNIDSSIKNINKRLTELGIVGFNVIKYNEELYRISRDGSSDNAFTSLSEGEKTVISFLYFLELCQGQKSKGGTSKDKIVVIDDPISSLSHIYVFNICQFIKNELCNSNLYSQVLILTHSLYFFYELTFTNKEKRDENQKLFRIVKNKNGSVILDMKYEEIQNDYQSYWSIVKDRTSPDALIANCMRNILEYFFGFVEKQQFANIFQSKKLKDNKYQAFYRYMNRESHSLGQNIFDIKEFDYDVFRDGLKLIFEESGYPNHYKAMMK